MPFGVLYGFAETGPNHLRMNGGDGGTRCNNYLQRTFPFCKKKAEYAKLH